MRIRAFNAPFCARIATLGCVWLARDVPVGCRVASHAPSPLGRHRHAKACSRPRTLQTFYISLLLHLRIVWKLQYVHYSHHLIVPTQWYPLQVQGQTLRKSRLHEVLALPLTHTHAYVSRSLTSTLPGTYTIIKHHCITHYSLQYLTIIPLYSCLRTHHRCGPCHAIAPHYESLSKKYTNVNFLKCDVDAAKEVASSYSVSAM